MFRLFTFGSYLTTVSFVRVLGMLIAFSMSSCIIPLRSFDKTKIPAPPDYSNPASWAALPGMKDSADAQLPAYGITDHQREAKVDVFYVHPTTYQVGGHWNAGLDNEKVNRRTDLLPAKLQATVFNGSCKVYMPRYRGAILYAYFSPRHEKVKAMNLAYSDVKSAFLHYMKHDNHGRPLIIASHSQGSDHAVRLLREFFDKDTTIRKQLVAAYLPGTAIYDTTFVILKPASSATVTGGYVTWNTVEKGTNTFYGNDVGKIVCVNPLTWTTDTAYAPAPLNKGGLPVNFTCTDPGVVDAQCAPSGFLWIHRPKHPAGPYFRLHTRFFHKDDYQFFYMNIRANVQQRIDAYFLQLDHTTR